MNINASMEKYYTVPLSLGEEVVSRNYHLKDYFLLFENICIFLDMLYLLFVYTGCVLITIVELLSLLLLNRIISYLMILYSGPIGQKSILKF